MRINQLRPIALLVVVSFLLSSCLTFETKEYTWKLGKNGKGTLTIDFFNIMSEYDDEEMTPSEQADQEYRELMDDYVNGRSLEGDFPDAKVKKKKLYKKNGVLCGQIVFQFNSLEEAKLFTYNPQGPYFYHLFSFSETFNSTNGIKGPDYLDAYIWPENSKKLTLKMDGSEPGANTTSLLSRWKK